MSKWKLEYYDKANAIANVEVYEADEAELAEIAFHLHRMDPAMKHVTLCEEPDQDSFGSGYAAVIWDRC